MAIQRAAGGDTLVVDTVDLRDGLWADFWGSPLTDRARMTERIRRPRFGARDRGHDRRLQAYGRPWTVAVNQQPRARHGAARIRLLENEKDVPRLVGK